MTLESQVCSLELSRKLKELGVKQESYFKWFCTNKKYARLAHDWSDTQHTMFEEVRTEYSAFTVAELGELCKWKPLLIYGVPNGLMNLINDEITMADFFAKSLIYLLENNLITL